MELYAMGAKIFVKYFGANIDNILENIVFNN